MVGWCSFISSDFTQRYVTYCNNSYGKLYCKLGIQSNKEFITFCFYSCLFKNVVIHIIFTINWQALDFQNVTNVTDVRSVLLYISWHKNSTLQGDPFKKTHDSVTLFCHIFLSLSLSTGFLLYCRFHPASPSSTFASFKSILFSCFVYWPWQTRQLLYSKTVVTILYPTKLNVIPKRVHLTG